MKGQEDNEHAKESLQLSEPGGFDVRKVRFVIKHALCLYLKICFPLQREAYFQKNHEKKWSESKKWSQNLVRYIKIPPTWGRIHEDGIKIMSDISLKSPKEATCSNNTHICYVLLRFSLGGMEGIKGERSEQQSDRAENHHQKRARFGFVSRSKE